MFDYNTYGEDLNLFYPFKDERFSLEGRIGYVGLDIGMVLNFAIMKIHYLLVCRGKLLLAKV